MLLREDPPRLSDTGQAICRVVSARLIELNGLRAVATWVPMSLVSHYFQAGDGDAVEVYAELENEHLTFRERTSKREFFNSPGPQSPTPAH